MENAFSPARNQRDRRQSSTPISGARRYAPFPPVDGYSNLEYDLERIGHRGKRDVHAGRLLDAILGKPAITVNNGAAALFLVLNELAAGGEAVISRGELIEIGDGFRIPEIMHRSGAALHEVGTTNRTHVDDYRAAINERTRVILRVHPSNFRMTGFTARPELGELVQLGRERGIPVYEDLGSGCIVDLRAYGVNEPLAQDSLEAGVNLLSFSGDKLWAVRRQALLPVTRNWWRGCGAIRFFRALRQDKRFHQAMVTHLAAYSSRRAGLRPGTANDPDDGGADPQARRKHWRKRSTPKVTLREGESVIGGGATPEQSLPTCLIVIANKEAVAEERRLRLGNPPIITRIERDQVVLDLRTVFTEEEDAVVQALNAKSVS